MTLTKQQFNMVTNRNGNVPLYTAFGFLVRVPKCGIFFNNNDEAFSKMTGNRDDAGETPALLFILERSSINISSSRRIL